MYQFNPLFESIGRDLIKADSYDPRKDVVAKIIAKYPNGKALSVQLYKLSQAEGIKPKQSATLAKYAAKARSVSNEDYPALVSKLAGISKLWKIIAWSAAGAVAAAGAGYLVYNLLHADAQLTGSDNAVVRLKPGSHTFGDTWNQAKANMSSDWDSIKSGASGAYNSLADKVVPSRIKAQKLAKDTADWYMKNRGNHFITAYGM
jgi:hypothetical protein